MRGILAAKKSSKKLRAASSVHSEDSSSSKDDKKKDDSSAPDLDFSEKEEKCLNRLKGIKEVHSEVIKEIEFIFKKYNEYMSKEKKGRLKAEAELFYKIEKMSKYLESTTGLQEEVRVLKEDLQRKEKENIALKFELDESHEREQDLYDENKSLAQKIEQLDTDLDKKQLEDKIKEGDVKGKTKENYIKEIGRLKRELDMMEGRLFQSQSECKTLEKRLREKEKDYLDMEEMVKTHKYDVMKNEQKRKVVEADLDRALNTMSDLKTSVSKHYETFKKAVHELTKKDEENFELKKTLKILEDQQMTMSKYVIELRDRLEYLSKIYFEVEEQNSKLKALCSNQTGTLEVIKKKSIDIENFQEKWVRRLDFVNKKRKTAISQTKNLSNKLMLKMKEIQHNELVVVKLNKRIKELQKEKDLCNEKLKKISDFFNKEREKSSTHSNLVSQLNSENEQLKKKNSRLQQEIMELYQYSNMLHKDLKAIEGQKAVTSAELQAAFLRLFNFQNQVNKREKEVKKITLKYDNAFIEKKTLQSRLIASKELVKDSEFKINHLCDKINKYKQQIDINDNLVTRLLRRLKRVDLDYTHLNIIFKQEKFENQNLQNEIRTKEKEKNLLNKLITNGEQRRTNLFRDVERLQRKVSILKTAIQQKNSEVKVIYQKTELMSFVMKIGEHEMKQRLTDISLLKSDILKLRSENIVLKKVVESNGNLQKEIISLSKDLSLAKQKYRALEEQMENPINVHRWRILKGNDPDKNELIEKNQILLKKLLKAECKNLEYQEQLHSLKSQYRDFKIKGECVPEGNKFVQKLYDVKLSLRNKTAEVQSLSAELSSYQRELREVKKVMEERKIKSDECMKQYFEMKKIFDEEKMSKMEKMVRVKEEKQ